MPELAEEMSNSVGTIDDGAQDGHISTNILQPWFGE
jgi:hypothetical protein